jgi:SAM-dependent methyltransferase
LEVGCGTGQLSVPLAEHGAELVAVELGQHLASIARRRLDRFPDASVIVSAFEEWELPPEPFDIVTSATAFHWLDPAIRVKKVADALRPGGKVAIVETHWGVGPEVDRFSLASQACYERWDPHHDPDFRLPTVSDLPKTNPDLDGSDLFGPVTLRRYDITHEYTTESYLALLGTWSNILGMDEHYRAGLLNSLGTLIDQKFGGGLMRHDCYDLWVTTKKENNV